MLSVVVKIFTSAQSVTFSSRLKDIRDRVHRPLRTRRPSEEQPAP